MYAADTASDSYSCGFPITVLFTLLVYVMVMKLRTIKAEIEKIIFSMRLSYHL